MAHKTTLGVFGVPGAPQIFVAKTPAVGGGPHPVGQVTTLGVGGWPGAPQTFVAKTPEVGAPHPVGQITALGLGAWPGGPQTFTAKTPEAFQMGAPEIGYQHRHGWNRYRVLQWGGRFKPGSR